MKMLELLYVVVLNYNLKEDTIACVESVLSAGAATKRIIVVDNGSMDGSVEAFASRFGPELILVCLEKNQGFAGGMNAGIRQALERGAAEVLVLSNDTVIDPSMITILLDAVAELDRPDILAPAIFYYDDPKRLWRLGDMRRRWLPMPMAVRLNATDLSNRDPFRVDYVTGCAMLVQRAVFERVGMFDTRFFAYYEDADFCERASNAGFGIWCVPQARMWHKVSLTTKRDMPFYHYLRARNQVRFYRDRRGTPVFLRESYLIAKMLKTAAADVLRGDWNLLGPLLRGIVDGYSGR